MKRLVSYALLLCLWLPALGQETVTFMPQWVPQTQFAGYYVAMEKGFYAEEGVNVVLDHFGGSSSNTVIGRIAAGDVDIVTSQLVTAMVARSRGVPLVNVLQTAQTCGLMCVMRTPVSSPEQLDGKRIGRWKVGFGEICDIFCYKNALEVEWIPYLQGINLLVSGAVDGLLCYDYSEYIQLVLATGGIPDENQLHFRDYGLNYPEDGLYVTEKYYAAHPETVEKFVRASRRGWDYAREHPEEALDISLEYIQSFHVATNRSFQQMMLRKVLDGQVNPDSGQADFAPVKRTVFDEMNAMLQAIGILQGTISYEEMIR